MERWSITAPSLPDGGGARCWRAVTDTRPRPAPGSGFPGRTVGCPGPRRRGPVGALPDGVDVDQLMAEAFDPAGPLHQTYAVVIIHRGRLVLERYGGLLPQWDKPGKPASRETPLLSWSMAKSMLHAVVGMLGMEQHVAVRVSGQALGVIQRHSADAQRDASLEFVRVKAKSDTCVHLLSTRERVSRRAWV